MILGSSTGRPSLTTRAGTRCPGFCGMAPDCPSVLDLESASSDVLHGAGVTGGTTGMTVEHSSIIMNGSPTAGILVTTGSPTVISATAATSTMAMRSTETDLAAEVRGSTALRRLTFSEELVPVRSVGLITAETSEAFLPAGGRALEVDPMEAVSMVVVDAIGDGTNQRQSLSRHQKWRRTPCCTEFHALLNLNERLWFDLQGPFCSRFPWVVLLHERSLRSRDSGPLPRPKTPAVLSLTRCI